MRQILVEGQNSSKIPVFCTFWRNPFMDFDDSLEPSSGFSLPFLCISRRLDQSWGSLLQTLPHTHTITQIIVRYFRGVCPSVRNFVSSLIHFRVFSVQDSAPDIIAFFICRWVVKSTKSLLPGKNVPVQCFDIIRSRKNPLSPIENPHKSPFRKFFYDHSKVELFSLLCSNFYKKNLSITRQRKDATAVAQLTLFLNARVSYHKCHTHNKLDAFWYRFTKQVLKFIRCSVCFANWYRKIQLTYILV